MTKSQFNKLIKRFGADHIIVTKNSPKGIRKLAAARK